MNLLRLVIALVSGWSLLLFGLVMIPMPGPGLPFLLAGLAVLAPYSSRARLLMMRLKAWANKKSRPAA